MREKKANESVTCRQQRLANQCQYEKEKKANESVTCRQQRLANQHQYEKEKIANKSVECRQQRLQSHHESRKNISNSLTIANEIQNFMLLFLEVHCTVALALTNCGIDIVLSMLKG